MSNFIKSRYYLHLIIGFAIGYNLMSLSDFNEYVWYNKIVGSFAITFICFWFGFFWEWMQSKFFEGKTDWSDIRWSAIGGFVSTIVCYLWFSNDYIFYLNIILIIIFVGKDIIKQVKK
jgi:hypothetical protein